MLFYFVPFVYFVDKKRILGSLQISYYTKRKRGKEWAACEPSRFIAELPQGEMVYAGVAAAGSAPAVSKNEGMEKLARLKAMLG